MSLTPGARLGVYEVVALLGSGGMGEVYRARDTRLGRDVALKILPELFAHDPDRLARLQREAQVLGSLNHPNIAIIHGLEESEGMRALVLELVEGPTLADRIAQGPLPIEEALPIARQITEALEAAHEQGVIHRDLKPANIKLKVRGEHFSGRVGPHPHAPDGSGLSPRTEDGRLERRLSAADVADCTVKVLDFGLAKVVESRADLMRSAGPEGPAYMASQSPTITTPAATRIGVIMGTAAYMSPEQARGKAVDKRADIWAFGCVLYEMLTGARAFDGDDATVVVASIIKSDVQWNVLPADTPPRVRTVLKGCLQKDPRQRVQDIGDVRLALEGAFDSTAAVAGTTQPDVRPTFAWRRALPWAAGLVVRFEINLHAGGAGRAPARRAGPTRVTRAFRAEDGWAVRRQDPPKVNFETHSKAV